MVTIYYYLDFQFLDSKEKPVQSVENGNEGAEEDGIKAPLSSKFSQPILKYSHILNPSEVNASFLVRLFLLHRIEIIFDIMWILGDTVDQLPLI